MVCKHSVMEHLVYLFVNGMGGWSKQKFDSWHNKIGDVHDHELVTELMKAFRDPEYRITYGSAMRGVEDLNYNQTGNHVPGDSELVIGPIREDIYNRLKARCKWVEQIEKIQAWALKARHTFRDHPKICEAIQVFVDRVITIEKNRQTHGDMMGSKDAGIEWDEMCTRKRKVDQKR